MLCVTVVIAARIIADFSVISDCMQTVLFCEKETTTDAAQVTPRGAYERIKALLLIRNVLTHTQPDIQNISGVRFPQILKSLGSTIYRGTLYLGRRITT